MATISRLRAHLSAALLLTGLLLAAAACGDDEPELTTCLRLCPNEEDGTAVNCSVAYDFAALSEELQARPDLVEQLGISEVTTCQEAEFVSRVLD
jgi:hypothetical protein